MVISLARTSSLLEEINAQTGRGVPAHAQRAGFPAENRDFGAA